MATFPRRTCQFNLNRLVSIIPEADKQVAIQFQDGGSDVQSKGAVKTVDFTGD